MNVEDPITKQINFIEAYDSTYGIYDHTSPTASPMAVFAMHPHEDTITNNHLVTLMFRIMASKLPEYTNCSLTDLLEYPRPILMQLLVRAEEETTTKNAKLSNLATLMDHQ